MKEKGEGKRKEDIRDQKPPKEEAAYPNPIHLGHLVVIVNKAYSP